MEMIFEEGLFKLIIDIELEVSVFNDEGMIVEMIFFIVFKGIFSFSIESRGNKN